MGLKEKYIKNSLFNISGWTWLVVLNILTIPYMIHKLGYDNYGILSLVFLVLGYFAFLDFGLGDAVIKYVSHYHAVNNIDKINKIVNSILALFVIVGIIGAGSIVLFTKFLALKVFKIPAQLQLTALYCFYLSSVGFFLNLIFGVISKIPEALQRFDLSNENNVIIGTAITSASVLTVFLGYGLKEVVLVNIFGSLFGIVLFLFTVKNLMPKLSLNLIFDYESFYEIIHFGLYTIFTKFSSLITSSVNQLFISSVIGTAGVTIFNVPFKIISKAQALIYRLAFTIFPVASELNAQENPIKLQEVYLKLSKYVFLLSSSLFVPLLAYSKNILFYWLGADFAKQGSYVMIMACMAFYLISLTMIPGLVALGLGKPKYNAFFSFLTACINIIFVYPLTRIWGINGAASALFLSSFQVPLAIYVINKKVVNIGSNKYFGYVFGKNAIFIIGIFLFYTFIGSKLMINFFSFLLVLLFSYIFLVLILYKVGIGRDDQDFFIRKLQNIALKISYLK